MRGKDIRFIHIKWKSAEICAASLNWWSFSHFTALFFEPNVQESFTKDIKLT